MILRQELIQRIITSIILIYIVIASYTLAPWWMVSALLTGALSIILIKEWPYFHMPWLTPFYPVLPFLCLIALNHENHMLLPLLFVTVSSYDAGAYCIGKLIGSRKLLPAISPGKTWEGAWGGLCISWISTYFFLVSHHYTPAWLPLGIFCLLLNTAGTCGDLFESFLKRRVGIKDAGSILPGHGGLLDRLDGILGAALLLYPFRASFVTLLGL